MAEPKKETVRIALPPRPEHAGGVPPAAKRDTARIVLPSRTPVTPIRRLPPKITPLPAADSAVENSAPGTPRRPPLTTPSSSSPLLQPLPKPPGADQSTAIRPTPIREENGSAINRGPKQETARISVLPRPVPQAAPPINMTKTQPLLIHPAAGVAPTPVVITSRPIARPEGISRSLCWAIFSISALIFLIQIWNYVVS